MTKGLPTAQDMRGRLTDLGGGSWGKLIAQGNTPTLTSPDFTFTSTADGTQPTEMTPTAYITYGATDPTNGANKVISADYAPEGVQAGDNGCWSEINIEIPNAVQVILKFKEYIPATYSNANVANHKSVGFASGPYGITASNISVRTECWPATGGATPSMYIGMDGFNYGHWMTTGDPLLWENGDGAWHEIVAVLELAPAQGQFGRYRIYRDGVKLIDSDAGNGMYAPFGEVPSHERVTYATRGNYIDSVRLCGWANVDDALNPAFAGTMHFLYDDIEITANATFKPIAEPE